MKHKTSELTGALLDAAVAKAIGILVTPADDHPTQPGHCKKLREEWGCHVVRWFAADEDGNETAEEGGWEAITNWGSPSTNWNDGGPIIERERIDVAAPDEFSDDERWFAGIYHDSARHATPRNCEMRGETPLIAAMRAFVAYKLGEEVDL